MESTKPTNSDLNTAEEVGLAIFDLALLTIINFYQIVFQ